MKDRARNLVIPFETLNLKEKRIMEDKQSIGILWDNLINQTYAL